MMDLHHTLVTAVSSLSFLGCPSSLEVREQDVCLWGHMLWVVVDGDSDNHLLRIKQVGILVLRGHASQLLQWWCTLSSSHVTKGLLSFSEICVASVL